MIGAARKIFLYRGFPKTSVLGKQPWIYHGFVAILSIAEDVSANNAIVIINRKNA
jgi:hypothetical protein